MDNALNSFSYRLPEAIDAAVKDKFDEWQRENKIARLWAKDATLWSNDGEENWLGWLDIVERELGGIEKYKDFKNDFDQSGFQDIALLGMGGSSLCPEVFCKTFERENFHVLDSTVPAQIKTLESKIDLAKTLFIVSSKSGSTLEPNSFKQYFFERVSDIAGAENAGRQFVAITDPNSKMQTVAEAGNFRKIFYGEPTIGGRFSAMSAFGLAPAAAMDIDVEDFLTRAMRMVNACKSDAPQENPGAVLGLILGICQTAGRDKLTVFTSAGIADLGAWLEQLVAESTGKSDISIIPVSGEKIQTPGGYGDDRVFAYLKLAGDSDDEQERAVAELEKSNQPVVRMEVAAKMDLGQEFFRWEFAIAVAGSIMRINTFNQPDVEAAKIEARKLTEEYEKTGTLPDEKPFYEENGIKLFTDEKNTARLDEILGGNAKSLANYLRAHTEQIEEDDYFALLAYIEMDAENESALQRIRERVLGGKRVATCLGFGPRFLHSTGQAYKGGANEGVFLQITSDDAADLDVPDQKYTFGVVKAAQARGDFQVLLDRDRRALRVHLGADVKKGL